MSMKDVWKSAIETSGEQFVTVDLTQVMPGQHVAKLDTQDNLLVSYYLLLLHLFGRYWYLEQTVHCTYV